MKFTIFALIAVTANAFTRNNGILRNPTQLSATTAPPDLVQAALETSRKYGAQSPEARLAWETVEEMNSCDDSAANIETPVDYERNLKQLAEKIKEQQQAAPMDDVMNSNMAEEIKAVKLSAPDFVAGTPSEELKEAVATAKKLSNTLGVHSPEAKIAWEIVEAIGSAGRSANALGGMLTAEECLVDSAQEACEALVELDRAINQSSK